MHKRCTTSLIMNSETATIQAPLSLNGLFNADRFGVLASILCGIHCAATPVLLLILPTFGKIWAHPASHWGMAILVIPIAALMMSKGYQRHRRTWILAIGSMGIIFVLAGAAAPYLETAAEPQSSSSALSAPSDKGRYEAEQCIDSCCPSVVTQDDGNQRLVIPTASILTTVGGGFLIATHLGNLCCCSCCRRKKRNRT